MARDHALHHLQHRRDQFGLRGQQQTQRYRQRQHPLSHRNTWDDVVHPVRRGPRHAPRAARGAEPATLAAEGQQLVVAALAAAQPQEAVRPDAALEEGIQLVLDEPGQLGTRAGFGVGDEAGCVLLGWYSVVCSGRWRSQRTGAPSGARWGCRPMACAMGSRRGEPARSQAVLLATIAQRVARRCVRSVAGPPSGVSLRSDRRLQGGDFEGADVGSGSDRAGQVRKERPFTDHDSAISTRRSAVEGEAVMPLGDPRMTGFGLGRLSASKSERLHPAIGGQAGPLRRRAPRTRMPGSVIQGIGDRNSRSRLGLRPSSWGIWSKRAFASRAVVRACTSRQVSLPFFSRMAAAR